MHTQIETQHKRIVHTQEDLMEREEMGWVKHILSVTLIIVKTAQIAA